MSSTSKKLSSPFSTGGGGYHFEAHVQASYVALMLTGGYAPSLPCWPIKKIRLQGKKDGFNTDDVIVFVEKQDKSEKRKLLGQIKHSIQLTKGSSVFFEVIQAMWNDFNNPNIFSKGNDILALITGPLSTTDTHNVQWLLDQARHTTTAREFLSNVDRANFSPSKSKEKLEVFQHHLKKVNNNKAVSDEKLYSFIKHFRWLGYDLGKEVGVVLSLLHSHISQFNSNSPQDVWSRVVDIVQTWNQDAGTLTLDNLPEDLRSIFKDQRETKKSFPKDIAEKLAPQEGTALKEITHQSDLAIANLIGSWDENSEGDKAIISELAPSGFGDWIRKMREILTNG